MWLLDRIAERRISEAISRGDFDDPPGRGEPLRLIDDPLVPEALRVAYRLLNNAGYVPAEIGLRREINELNDLLGMIDEPQSRVSVSKRLGLMLQRLDASRGTTVSLQIDECYRLRALERLEHALSEPARTNRLGG